MALGLVALLTLAGQIMVQRYLQDQTYDARVINLAGRQRMLSQLIATQALAVATARSRLGMAQAAQGLKDTFDSFIETHNGLLHGSRKLGLPPTTDQMTLELFKKLQPILQDKSKKIVALLVAVGEDKWRGLYPLAVEIRDLSVHFHNLMEQVVSQYEKLAEDKLARLRWVELSFAGVQMVVLFLTALLLFRPAVARISRDMKILAEAGEKLRALSYQDALTQIPNRRYFNEFLAREWPRALRDKKSMALIMLDIDYFKAYNDHFGHQEGDRALAALARVIKSQVRRPGDCAARYGGEEFAVVLTNTDSLGAATVAEGIKRSLAHLAIPHPHGGPKKILSVSLGVASMAPTGKGDAPTTLIEAADCALYRAKESGRDRVLVAAPGQPKTGQD